MLIAYPGNIFREVHDREVGKRDRVDTSDGSRHRGARESHAIYYMAAKARYIRRLDNPCIKRKFFCPAEKKPLR